MQSFEEIEQALRAAPRRFVVTGAAGFIGSHLTERLLRLGQTVVGVDNFATGRRANLTDVMSALSAEERARFRFMEGDIRVAATCAAALEGAHVVLHQAALGSVPRSMKEPLDTHSANVDGFINVLLAAHAAGVRRVVYASSSSVYGDDDTQPKVETRIGRPLSPYAATKLIDELYAATFQRTHGIRSIGLRYFNVFGPRQDPSGPYAAVIPRWIESLARGQECVVFGEGNASRDFCFVENIVQANLLAACAPDAIAHDVFNVACGRQTTLLELFAEIRAGVSRYDSTAQNAALRFEPPRAGDIPHSLASVARAGHVLGYEPAVDLPAGIAQTIPWYMEAVAPAARTGDGRASSRAIEAGST